MIEQIMRENLLVIAQTYADAKGWSLATVSKQIHGNQSFLTEFMAGNVSCGIGTYEQMLDRLRYGPATNRDLAEIGLKYTGRISDLRAAGYRIVVTSKCVETGRCIYELKEGGE